MFLITDNDNAGFNKNGKLSKKAQRFIQLQGNLKERFYCLKSREIENLLQPKVISSVLFDFEGKEIDFLKTTIDDYRNDYLGRYLEDNIQGLKKKYSADSGTILNKIEFAKKAVSYISTIEDLSEEARTLGELLYNFIKNQNR
ncbi:hypothetical protein A4R26_33920 [Niastella populi]|uniref:Uncharacterized protein n=1 Tax=Niastella populi TaxID=550983 RepID=A0A1V9FVT4_9BACT|nr:hypothetical protein A4R26_33920 [Niastella populi]